MIRSLYIKNYVLIDELDIGFSGGFTTMTGETGAGKSILMGALSLILGQRADTSVLKLKDSKCVVEGEFQVDTDLKLFFEDMDLDFDPVTTMRREISPAGKSRAFINDSPVNLPVMKQLGSRLVDIHSQHQNLLVGELHYQMEVVDYLAASGHDLERYRKVYDEYNRLRARLNKHREEVEKLKEDLDFLQFQYNELDSARLDKDELETLESDFQRAAHSEEIGMALEHASYLMGQETNGILDQLKEMLVQLNKISDKYDPARDLHERLESSYIELKDLAGELSRQSEREDPDPGRMEKLQERLDLLYGLMQKYRVNSVPELIESRDRLSDKIDKITFSDEEISGMERELQALFEKMDLLSATIHGKREEAGNNMQSEMETRLQELGIPNARFRVEVRKKQEFDAFGKDEVAFLFSANKQSTLEELSRVASGGELSRVMLCIKAMVSDRQGMPTLIFDEIDAGVSGEIARKVGGIMDKLSRGRQVLAITHLPQVAAMGEDQLLVYKEDSENATHTRLRKLSSQERIEEIARMLSGEEVSSAALSNARELLRV